MTRTSQTLTVVFALSAACLAEHPSTAHAATAASPAALTAGVSAGLVLPMRKMAANNLAPSGFAHHAVLQIDQDFHPNDAYEIAIDAWSPDDSPHALAAVRMWWLDTSDANARSPFGKGVRRHIDIDYDRRNDASWEVSIKQGRKRFRFTVRNSDGDVDAFADVRSAGRAVPNCRIERSRLVARKVLGIPAGLKRLEVTCRDEQGQSHRGSVLER